MRTFYKLLIILTLLPTFALGEISLSGSISRDTTWSGIVRIDGDVIVDKHAVLTIEPGTRVIVNPRTDSSGGGKKADRIEIIVLGTLIADGTSGDGQITFTSGAFLQQMHDWYGLVFRGKNSQSLLKNCIIEYGYNGVTCYGASPRIESSVVQYNYFAGINCEVRAAPFVRSSIILGNAVAGINCELFSNPVIENSIITQNGNGILVFDRSQPQLGKRNPKAGESIGENYLINNFNYNVYNRSERQIFIQNNFWNSAVEADIDKTIFDNNNNIDYGEVVFTPYLKTNRLVTQLPKVAANTKKKTQPKRSSKTRKSSYRITSSTSQQQPVTAQHQQTSNQRQPVATTSQPATTSLQSTNGTGSNPEKTTSMQSTNGPGSKSEQAASTSSGSTLASGAAVKSAPSTSLTPVSQSTTNNAGVDFTANLPQSSSSSIQDAVNATETRVTAPQQREEKQTDRQEKEIESKNLASVETPEGVTDDSEIAAATAAQVSNGFSDINIEKVTDEEQRFLDDEAAEALAIVGLSTPSSFPEPPEKADSEPEFDISTVSSGSSENSGRPKLSEPVIESFLDGGRRRYLKKQKPDYPSGYANSGVEGLVLMEVLVDKEGRIRNYRVLRSDGDPFTEAAKEAIKGYRYRPGTIQGIPVSFKIIERFEFNPARK